MKIGFVFDDSLDKPDGVQQYILTLGKWLISNGHEVHYLVGQSREREDVIVHTMSKNLKVQFNHNRMSTPFPANKQRIKTLLDAEQYDVLHIQMPYSPFLAGRIIKLAPLHTAVIGTFHILPYGLLSKLATKLLGLMLKNNGRRFDTVLSNSVATQYFAEHTYGVKSQVLPCVVDLQAFQTKKLVHQGFKIVFLGRLVERKGCEALLRAVALLPLGLKDQLSIDIGGKGPLLNKLKKISRKLGFGEGVIFDGFVNEADKAAFLAQADLAVFPAFSGESFGIILLEAMAAGASVVLAGNNPGYASVMGTIPEALFNPANSRSLAEKIELYMRDAALCSEVHIKQQHLVKQYDVAVVGTELLSIYQQAIAKRATNRDNANYDN